MHLLNQRFRGHPITQGVMRTFVRAAKLAFVVEVVNRQPEQSVVLSIDGSGGRNEAGLVYIDQHGQARNAY